MIPAPTDGKIDIRGEELILLPERAIYLPARETLLIADLHLGKTASFQFAGLPVPDGPTASTLARLGAAIDRCAARRVLLLGDLLHNRRSVDARTNEIVMDWRRNYSAIELRLVRGNHDRHAGDPPAEWKIEAVPEPLCEGPFAFKHMPEPEENAYVLAGHIHPAIRLSGRGRQQERLRCFLFGEQVGLLPAFGEFTGAADVTPGKKDRVFVVTEEEVFPLALLGK